MPLSFYHDRLIYPKNALEEHKLNLLPTHLLKEYPVDLQLKLNCGFRFSVFPYLNKDDTDFKYKL